MLDKERALALLHEHQGHKTERVAHSLAVAHLAVAIARLANANGCGLDQELIESAAILHDIKKGQPDHDRLGGELLRSLGHPGIAAIVEVHTRLGGRTPTPEEPVSEAEVVYIADKSYRRTNRVSIEERYGIWRNTWKDDPERLASLTTGENRAKAVRARVERVLGQALDQVIVYEKKEEEASGGQRG